MSDAIHGLRVALDKVVVNPRYHDLLAVLKGARNGAVYGTKVRFPHALVMVLLFRSGTLREKLWTIFRATRTHARNLAKFATIYKLTCLLLKKWRPENEEEGLLDTMLAGAIGGYFVFGGRSRHGKISSVNQQIVVYVFARVVLAMTRLCVKQGSPLALPYVSEEPLSSQVSYYAWPVFASLSWGIVMWLFRWHPEELQPSLRSSMNYIYAQSDHWDSLRTLLWYNK